MMRSVLKNKNWSVWMPVILCFALAVFGYLFFMNAAPKRKALIFAVAAVIVLLRGDRRRLWNLPTLLLMGVSLLLGLLIAVPAGIYSAVHRYQKRDFAVVTASFLGSSIPSFFLALILIYVFTVRLGWLPSSGMSTAGTGGDFWDVVRHLIMPATVLAVSVAGSNIRYIRSAVLEILEMDYLRTARAKGIGRFRVINKHALRNALLPIVTVIGMQIPTLFGGAVIIEQIFAWPGLGLITMSAITGRDYPVIMGVCLLSAVVVQATNLLTDLMYALVDPTIKY